MKVILANTSGFCNGVRRAMGMAVDAARRYGGLRADGPLVHNRQAMEHLARHGVVEFDGLPGPGAPILIRAHGVPPARRGAWEEAGLPLVDATCLHVRRNQELAASAAADGRVVLLAGDGDHAEVRAVAACAGGRCVIVSAPADIESVDAGAPVFLMAQTTFGIVRFEAIAAAVRERFSDAAIRDTICRSTHDRQLEAAALAEATDAVVVVGGRHSANTARLAEVAAAAGVPVFPVETAEELREGDFAAFATIGVTAGASTPDWVTREVVERLERM